MIPPADEDDDGRNVRHGVKLVYDAPRLAFVLAKCGFVAGGPITAVLPTSDARTREGMEVPENKLVLLEVGRPFLFFVEGERRCWCVVV